MHLEVRVFAVSQAAGHRAMNVTRYDDDILDFMDADGLQDSQALLGEGFPGIAVIAFTVWVEHDTGDHEFDPRRAIDQPLEQGLLLVCIEDASIIGREVAPGSAVRHEPLGIPLRKPVPVMFQFARGLLLSE
ncbi:hypothetical protein D3C84_1000490 [compost metagenome]